MTRTSLLAATAIAALATSSLLVTDADARGHGGFAGHGHVSRPTARPVVARPVNRFRPASHTVIHPVSHRTFIQAHYNNFSQAHQPVAHQNFSQHQIFGQHQNRGNFPAAHQVASKLAHPGQAGTTGLASTHPAFPHPTVATNGAANVKSGTVTIGSHNNIAMSGTPNAKNGNATFAATHHKHETNPNGTNLRASKADIKQVANVANADQKAGQADVNKANELRGEAKILQQKAAQEKKFNPLAAKKDAKQASNDLAQANNLQAQGQKLLKDAKAERDVLAALKDKQKGPKDGGTKDGGTAAMAGGGQDAGQPGGSSQAASSAPSTATPGDNNQPAPATQIAAQAPGTATQLALNATQAAPQNLAVSFKALSLAWNQDGGWVVRTADALPAASTEAVSTCNGQFGSCQQAASVDAGAFGCLAVMSTADNQLFSATGTSLDAVTTSLQQKLDSMGVKGEVQYSGCNNG
jgi:hypothetical protein